MPLAPCRECRREVSDEAPRCPHCGAPRPAVQDWRGTGYEWKSQASYLGYPLIHIAVGRDAKGGRRVAKGVIAIGQYAIGAVTIAQFGVGLLFGFGQFIVGLNAVSQFAAALLFGLGQFATGYVAIGQFAAGGYVLAQLGYGLAVWSSGRRDPEAAEFFRNLAQQLGLPFDFS